MKKHLCMANNKEKASFVWNMLGSLFMAFQSVIMLMILTRTIGIVEAGIFTIAYANANLFLTIGKYGVRFFQVSDVEGEYSFGEYFLARCITSIAMIIVSIGYAIYIGHANEYEWEKTAVIICMCAFKVPDAIEDVFCGLYQQKGRLDVGAKILTIRVILTIFIYGLGIVVFENQLQALIVATIFTTVLLILFLKRTYSSFKEKECRVVKKKVSELLKVCAPVFLGTFLVFYIGNAPKYAIDSQLSDEVQACYGFIAMPVFVIGLLNGFIFNPMLYKISHLWNEGKIREFLSISIKQIGIIMGITISCLIGAYAIGIPILSVLYNTDLVDYKLELLILLVGGGFLGMSGLLSALITIIRFQHTLVYAYGFVALLAMFFSNYVVRELGVFGASLLYTVLMIILSTCFIVLLFWGVNRQSKINKVSCDDL